MIRLIKYIYYRISHVYDRERNEENDWYYDYLIKDTHYKKGGLLTGGLVGINILSIIMLIFNVDILPYHESPITKGGVALCFGALGFLLASKNNYEKLCNKYKDDKFKFLKGCLIVAYIIGSLIVYYYSIPVK